MNEDAYNQLLKEAVIMKWVCDDIINLNRDTIDSLTKMKGWLENKIREGSESEKIDSA